MLNFGKKLAIMLACIIATKSFAQTIDYQPSKIAPAALRSDFKILWDSLEKIHPGLYRYNSKARMDHIFDSCFASIKDSQFVTGYYGLISYVMASIGDGHANCRLPKPVQNDYMNHVKVFPAMVLFIHNRAFVFCCKRDDRLTGAELLSINGLSMDTIIQCLFRYITTDGTIQSRKNWELPEFFHLLYNIVYGESDSYRIKYRAKEGDIKTTVLQADILNNLICQSPFVRPAKYLQLTYTTDNIAVLTLRTFFDDFLQSTGENFQRFLDSAFDDMKVKKVTRLIIDIRRNQGGYDHNGEIVYSYLTQKPFRYYASQESVKGKITESQNHDLGLQQPKENSFSGKVYFLIDGRSFSAAAEFAAIAKSEHRGLFIGEETGGGYYGNTSGSEVFVSLPATQISCRIPEINYMLAVKKAPFTDRGVLPDYPVYPTIYDILDKTDGQMDLALKIAAKE